MAKRKFRYDEGGDVEAAANASEESQDIARSMGAGPKNEDAPKAEKKQSFKEAFAEARKGGGKSFEWNGKKYSTAMASSTPAPAKEKPVNVTQSKEYAPGTSILDRSKADRDALVNLGLKRQEGERAVKEFKAKKAAGYAKGGSVGSASRRADGIATKGKTKGTMVAMCGGGMYKGKK